MMGIPKELFLLDESEIFKERNTCNGKTLIEKRLNTQTVIDTATTVTHRNEKLHLFTIGDETIYINKKYFNYFDQNNSTFTGTNKNSPIYVWKDQQLVGMIRPTRKDQRNNEGLDWKQ